MAARPLPNPQDAFAELVEEIRLGWVYRPELHELPKRHTKYIQHKPQVDLTCPVFYFGEIASQQKTAVLDAALESLEQHTFRLPYPRCCFLSSLSSDNPSLLLAALKSGTGDAEPRYYLTVAEQYGDGSIFCFSFMRHSGHDHWIRQLWQATIRNGHIDIAIDPQRCSEEFMDMFRASAHSRIEALLADVQQLMTRKTGRSDEVVGSTVTRKIDERRRKLNLPDISRVRRIDLTNPEPDVGTVRRIRTGTKGVPKRPHYRRGHWRNYEDGHQKWIEPLAIKGGSMNPPPWYEVKLPPPA
jgi:hypothetical protein